MARNPFGINSKTTFSRPDNQSAGISDDFAVRKDVETIEINAQRSNNPNVVTNLNADKADGYHFDQEVKTTSSPTFAGATFKGRVSQTDLGKGTYFGFEAGKNDDLTDNNNLGIGYQALTSSITGSDNIAIGYRALYSNLSHNNFAIGYRALFANTSGRNNLGLGYNALQANTTGYYNLGVGTSALYNLVGNYSDNTAIGYNAGYFQSDGSTALTTPSQSVYIGSGSMGKDNSDVNSIVIGYLAKGEGANTIRLGNTSITAVKTSGAITTTGGITGATYSVGATAGIDDSAAGTIVDVHATKGLVTTVTRVTPAADGTYITGLKLTPVTGTDGSITITNGIITAITAAT